MTPPLGRWYRTRRFGTPIIVVSGLPRSGTSMMMSMLEAGGLEVVTDGVRVADESNPRGYYESERVKTLETDRDKSWLEGARGKAIKIISFLLCHLPETNNYRVIFMQRNLDEVMTSQRKMLSATRAPAESTSEERIAVGYEHHLHTVKTLLMRRRCFEVLTVSYEEVVSRPRPHAERITRFVGVGLDVSKMAAAVDETLYRNRR